MQQALGYQPMVAVALSPNAVGIYNEEVTSGPPCGSALHGH
jgi:hypothetical protein